MDRPKGGTSMSLPHDPCIQYPSPCSLTLQLDSNCLGFLFVFALKIGATYARLFLASRVESLFFWIFFFCFSFLFFSFFVFCVHFVYFSRLVFCFFYAFAVLSLFFSRWIMHAGRPPIWANTVRCQRRRVQRGQRGLSTKRGTEDWGQSLNQ